MLRSLRREHYPAMKDRNFVIYNAKGGIYDYDF
jgi:hypothetical protein